MKEKNSYRLKTKNNLGEIVTKCTMYVQIMLDILYNE